MYPRKLRLAQDLILQSFCRRKWAREGSIEEPDKQKSVELTMKRSRLQTPVRMQTMEAHSLRGYERMRNATRKIREEER